jgi:hypothetical protein
MNVADSYTIASTATLHAWPEPIVPHVAPFSAKKHQVRFTISSISLRMVVARQRDRVDL